MAEDWESILRCEFIGDFSEEENQTFIVKLRSESGWDWEAFGRLFTAMRACCKALDGREDIPRWIAEGFWYLSWWPRSWMAHGGPEAVGPYENALVNLDHLAWWLFTGQGRADDEFEPMDQVPPV